MSWENFLRLFTFPMSPLRALIGLCICLRITCFFQTKAIFTTWSANFQRPTSVSLDLRNCLQTYSIFAIFQLSQKLNLSFPRKKLLPLLSPQSDFFLSVQIQNNNQHAQFQTQQKYFQYKNPRYFRLFRVIFPRLIVDAFYPSQCLLTHLL